MSRRRKPHRRTRPARPAGWLTLAATGSAAAIVCGSVLLAALARAHQLTILTSGATLAAADVFGVWLVAQGLDGRRPHRAARRDNAPRSAARTDAPPPARPEPIRLPRRILSRARPAEEWMPYAPQATIMTAAERRFYRALEEAVEGRGMIIGFKIRLADVVTVTVPLDDSDHWERFRKISQKHVDFVLCDRTITRPILAIELDDSSHEWDSRRKRDRFVNDVFTVAEIPLLRVQVRARYEARHLWHKIDHALISHQNRMQRTG